MPVPGTNLFMRSNTEMFVRILPPEGSSLEHVKILDDLKTIYIRYWQDFAKKQKNPAPRYLAFHTNGIFMYSPQSEIFDEITGNGLFEKLFYGNNAMILCYGQTGSGKSLTTSGLERMYEDRGLLPRIIEKLFEMKEQLSDRLKFSLKLRYVEMNRNYLVDLLNTDGKLYDMSNYKSIEAVYVESMQQGLKLLFKAEARKTVRQIDAYKSNIAHCITTFMIYTKGKNAARSAGMLHVIDLAGIDTVGNASCAHKKGYEVGNGNLAKSQIEQLVLIINENLSKTAILKQRLCILVHYLRHVLNPNSMIRIITHVRIECDDLKICASLLKLGCTFKGMTPKRLTRFLETSIDVQYQILADELRALKKEMDLFSLVSNEDMSGTLSSDRMAYIQEIAMEYLKGHNSELVLLTTTDTLLAMKVMKQVYKRLEQKYEECAAKMTDLKTLAPIEISSLRGSRKSSSVQSAVIKKTATVKKTASVSKGHKNKEAGKKSMASVPESSSQKSKATAGKKKVRSTDTHDSETNVSQIKLPDDIPDFKSAWSEYWQQEKDVAINTEIQRIESELAELTAAYNKHVHLLEECKSIANSRRHELNHAFLMKDVTESSDDLLEYQNHCVQLYKVAGSNILEQKENMLRIQAELRLNMEYKSKLNEELLKRFNNFCLQTYKILVPSEETAHALEPLDHAMPVSNLSKTVRSLDKQESEVCSLENREHEHYYKLQAYMQREIKRIQQLKIKNKKWINTFKLENC